MSQKLYDTGSKFKCYLDNEFYCLNLLAQNSLWKQLINLFDIFPLDSELLSLAMTYVTQETMDDIAIVPLVALLVFIAGITT